MAVLSLAALGLTGCSRETPFEPLPEQRPVVEAPDPPSEPCFVHMDETRAERFIVADIEKGRKLSSQRWTAQRPAVACTLPEGGAWQAKVVFGVSDYTLRVTGPIVVTFSVDGSELGRLRCEKPGDYEFAAPVPAGLSKAGGKLTLEAALDKLYVSPNDGAKRGLQLTAAGFLKR